MGSFPSGTRLYVMKGAVRHRGLITHPRSKSHEAACFSLQVAGSQLAGVDMEFQKEDKTQHTYK